MSPRAAWRLESLGFGEVYDYVAGKVDWLAFGLPREGDEAATPRAGDIARRDVPTCAPSDRIGTVRERVEAAGWDQCLVANDERVVLGRLRGTALSADAEARAEEVMEAGPTTVRPDERLSDLATRLRERDVASIVVTTPDGRLVGVLFREDAERRGAA